MSSVRSSELSLGLISKQALHTGEAALPRLCGTQELPQQYLQITAKAPAIECHTGNNHKTLLLHLKNTNKHKHKQTQTRASSDEAAVPLLHERHRNQLTKQDQPELFDGRVEGVCVCVIRVRLSQQGVTNHAPAKRRGEQQPHVSTCQNRGVNHVPANRHELSTIST